MADHWWLAFACKRPYEAIVTNGPFNADLNKLVWEYFWSRQTAYDMFGDPVCSRVLAFVCVCSHKLFFFCADASNTKFPVKITRQQTDAAAKEGCER